MLPSQQLQKTHAKLAENEALTELGQSQTVSQNIEMVFLSFLNRAAQTSRGPPAPGTDTRVAHLRDLQMNSNGASPGFVFRCLEKAK